MKIEEFERSCKIAVVAFRQDYDGDREADRSPAEWAAAWEAWLGKLAKLEVDTKRAAKVRKEAEAMLASAQRAGLMLVTRQQVVEQYDTAMSKLEAEVERLRAEVAALKGAD
jgi:hypothetical protein